MKTNNFNIVPIGSVYRDNEQQFIKIDSQFIKGLKNLSMFSHAIIIFKNNVESNIMNTMLSQKVIRLESVDEKQGMIITEDISKENNEITLYDMKPYFPNEDRVKNPVVPLSKNIRSSCLAHNQSLSLLGTIYKNKGVYYLEIPEKFQECTHVLQGYSHIKVFWWFHKFDKPAFRKTLECNPPYENAPKTGVFASRSPVRPNPLALTTAKILAIDAEKKRIEVSMLDCFDNTPLIGISPYIPDKDWVDEYRLPHWVEHWSKWLDDRKTANTKELPILEAATITLEKYAEHRIKKQILEDDYFDIVKDLPAYSHNEIVVKGARQNNLKSIDVTIPYNKITVITGVSGSGKSSLAFDTIYAESQHRFLASMSLIERSQFSLLEKPGFDQIAGLPPAVAISQQNVNRNPRSTVGTVTDIYDLLRTLFSNIGVRHCPDCGRAIIKLTIDEITAYLEKCKTGTIQRIKPFDAGIYIETLIVPAAQEENYLQYAAALRKIVEKHISQGKGAINVQLNDKEELILQTTEKCYHCDHIFFELSPADFSFNNPESMCPVCNGFGTVMDVDVNLIITNPDKSILDGAAPFWGNLRKFIKSPNANWMKGEIIALANEMKIDLEKPWSELPHDFKAKAIYGAGNKEVTFNYENKNGRTGTITRPVEGAYHIIKRLSQSTSLDTKKAISNAYMVSKPCEGCNGERLKLESRLVTVANKRFPEVINMSLKELHLWIRKLPNYLNNTQTDISQSILQELYTKLSDYIKVGLGYLTLNRSTPSLSGGELQRLLLVSQLSGGISNILYVLDEPTAGLHPKDYDKLLEIIFKLKNMNNTVIIVEHTPAIILAADQIIDIGSGAGVLGGHLVAQGTPQEIQLNNNSETGLYLSGKKHLKIRKKPNIEQNSSWVQITGVHGNNLKNIDISFPINAITCVTGVSGSGKSSLVNLGILPAVQSSIDNSINPNKWYDKVKGAGCFNRIIHITQKPIGRSSRSTPATYTGIMDEIRLLFSKTDMAIKQGYSQGKFSYNSKDGQCHACHGYGYKTLDVTFMPSTKITCPLCNGEKFNSSTLQVEYNGKNIAEILDMSVSEAFVFFNDHKKLHNILQLLNEIGLGYIKLGQNSQTLSGGEAQRIKLAAELNINNKSKTLFLLDEPTTGLHFSDIQNLLNILQKIVDNGNTVFLIEHNLDVIENTDWIIDLGPEGGNKGGNLVVQGTLQNIIECPNSHTGKLLKKKILEMQYRKSQIKN